MKEENINPVKKRLIGITFIKCSLSIYFHSFGSNQHGQQCDLTTMRKYIFQYMNLTQLAESTPCCRPEWKCCVYTVLKKKKATGLTNQVHLVKMHLKKQFKGLTLFGTYGKFRLGINGNNSIYVDSKWQYIARNKITSLQF